MFDSAFISSLILIPQTQYCTHNVLSVHLGGGVRERKRERERENERKKEEEEGINEVVYNRRCVGMYPYASVSIYII